MSTVLATVKWGCSRKEVGVLQVIDVDRGRLPPRGGGGR